MHLKDRILAKHEGGPGSNPTIRYIELSKEVGCTGTQIPSRKTSEKIRLHMGLHCYGLYLCMHLGNQTHNTQLEGHRLYRPRGGREELTSPMNSPQREGRAAVGRCYAGTLDHPSSQGSNSAELLKNPKPKPHTADSSICVENALEDHPFAMFFHLPFLLETGFCSVAQSGLNYYL